MKLFPRCMRWVSVLFAKVHIDTVPPNNCHDNRKLIAGNSFSVCASQLRKSTTSQFICTWIRWINIKGNKFLGSPYLVRCGLTEWYWTWITWDNNANRNRHTGAIALYIYTYITQVKSDLRVRVMANLAHAFVFGVYRISHTLFRPPVVHLLLWLSMEWCTMWRKSH